MTTEALDLSHHGADVSEVPLKAETTAISGAKQYLDDLWLRLSSQGQKAADPVRGSIQTLLIVAGSERSPAVWEGVRASVESLLAARLPKADLLLVRPVLREVEAWFLAHAATSPDSFDVSQQATSVARLGDEAELDATEHLTRSSENVRRLLASRQSVAEGQITYRDLADPE